MGMEIILRGRRQTLMLTFVHMLPKQT